MKKTKSGFTLVELIVVIAILGILVLITLPKFQQYVLEARVRKEIANAKTIYTAAVAYDEDNNTEQDFSMLSLYDTTNNKSLLTPFVGNDIDIKFQGYEVDEAGEYAVMKNPVYSGEVRFKIRYDIFYHDPRVNNGSEPYVQTALEDGIPVIYSHYSIEVDESGNTYMKALTVDEYLKQKAEEGKK